MIKTFCDHFDQLSPCQPPEVSTITKITNGRATRKADNMLKLKLVFVLFTNLHLDLASNGSHFSELWKWL